MRAKGTTSWDLCLLCWPKTRRHLFLPLGSFWAEGKGSWCLAWQPSCRREQFFASFPDRLLCPQIAKKTCSFWVLAFVKITQWSCFCFQSLFSNKPAGFGTTTTSAPSFGTTTTGLFGKQRNSVLWSCFGLLFVSPAGTQRQNWREAGMGNNDNFTSCGLQVHKS